MSTMDVIATSSFEAPVLDVLPRQRSEEPDILMPVSRPSPTCVVMKWADFQLDDKASQYGEVSNPFVQSEKDKAFAAEDSRLGFHFQTTDASSPNSMFPSFATSTVNAASDPLEEFTENVDLYKGRPSPIKKKVTFQDLRTIFPDEAAGFSSKTEAHNMDLPSYPVSESEDKSVEVNTSTSSIFSFDAAESSTNIDAHQPIAFFEEGDHSTGYEVSILPNGHLRVHHEGNDALTKLSSLSSGQTEVLTKDVSSGSSDVFLLHGQIESDRDNDSVSSVEDEVAVILSKISRDPSSSPSNNTIEIDSRCHSEKSDDNSSIFDGCDESLTNSDYEDDTSANQNECPMHGTKDESIENLSGNQDAGTNLVFVMDLEGDIPGRQSPLKKASVKENDVDLGPLLRLPKGLSSYFMGEEESFSTPKVKNGRTRITNVETPVAPYPESSSNIFRSLTDWSGNSPLAISTLKDLIVDSFSENILGVNTLENDQESSRQVEHSRSEESQTSDLRQVANKSSKEKHDVVARSNPDLATETQCLPTANGILKGRVRSHSYDTAKSNTSICETEFLYLDDLVAEFSTRVIGNIDEVNEETNNTAKSKDTDDSILPQDQRNESVTGTIACAEQESISNDCDTRNDIPLGARKAEWERSFFDPVTDSIVAESFLNIVNGEDMDKKRQPSKLDSNAKSTEEHQGLKACNGSQDSEDSGMFVDYGNISCEQESDNENNLSPSSFDSLKQEIAPKQKINPCQGDSNSRKTQTTNNKAAHPNMLLKSEQEARRNLRDSKCKKVQAYRRRRVRREKDQTRSTLCGVGKAEFGSKDKDKPHKQEITGSPSIEDRCDSPPEIERNHVSAARVAFQKVPRKDCDSISLPLSYRVNVNGTWDRKIMTTPVSEPCISTGQMDPKVDALAKNKSSPIRGRTITSATLLQADATTTAVKRSFPSQCLTGMAIMSTLSPTADARTEKRVLHSPLSTGRTITSAFPSDTHFSSIVPSFSSQKMKLPDPSMELSSNQNILLTSMQASTSLEEKTGTKVERRIKEKNSVISLSSQSSEASPKKSAAIARPLSSFSSPTSGSSSIQRSIPSPPSLKESKYCTVSTRKVGAGIASRISTLTGISTDFNGSVMAPLKESEASISKTTAHPSKIATKTLVSSPSSFRKVGDDASHLEAYSTTVKNPWSQPKEQRRDYQENKTYSASEGGLSQSPMTFWKENIAPLNKPDVDGRKKNQITERSNSTMRFQVQNDTPSVSPKSGGKRWQKPSASPPTQNMSDVERREKNQITERSNSTMRFQVQNVIPSVSPKSGGKRWQKPTASPPPQSMPDVEGRKKNQITERSNSTMRFQVQDVTPYVSPNSGDKRWQKPTASPPPQSMPDTEGRKKIQTIERSNATMRFQVHQVTPYVSPNSGDSSTQKPIASPPQPAKEKLSAAPTKKLGEGIASRISALNLS